MLVDEFHDVLGIEAYRAADAYAGKFLPLRKSVYKPFGTPQHFGNLLRTQEGDWKCIRNFHSPGDFLSSLYRKCNVDCPYLKIFLGFYLWFSCRFPREFPVIFLEAPLEVSLEVSLEVPRKVPRKVPQRFPCASRVNQTPCNRFRIASNH